jgi:uncharacterized protein (DUF1697 family)
MTRHVAFLRAVNVGRRRVRNPELVDLATGLGLTEVKAHLSTGNVSFLADDTTGLDQRLAEVFEDAYGFEVATFVRSVPHLRDVVAADPFPVADGNTHAVAFLAAAPTKAQMADIEALGDGDLLMVDGAEVHWRLVGGMSGTTITTRHWERILGPASSTVRNRSMLTKLTDGLDDG